MLSWQERGHFKPLWDECGHFVVDVCLGSEFMWKVASASSRKKSFVEWQPLSLSVNIHKYAL